MSDTPEKQPKKFSLRIKSIDIPIEGEDGEISTYVLKELTGQQRVQYLNRFKKKTRDGIGPGSQPKIETFTGMITDLLDLCLYGPDGILLKAEVIDKWPASMQQEIFDMAVELSGLSEKAKEEEKKD